MAQGDPGGSGATTSTPAGGSIIRIEHMVKIFASKHKSVTAVNDVSFSVGKGEIFGLLGPNGAGKSTLIRILSTLLAPTSGIAYLDTYEITKQPEKVRSIIGVCPQNSTLDLELTAYENLDFYGKLVDVPKDALDARIWELLAMTGLTDRAHMRVGTFSGGMRRKLEIVRAFIHRPLVLFLDEPTIGLDPEARREVWQQISDLNREQTTIILTTHYMDEAEKLCSRIAFIDRGRLIALDTLENLRQLLPAGDLIRIGLDTADDRILPAIRNTPLVTSVERDGPGLVISAKNGSRALPGIMDVIDAYSLTINSISIHSPSLEDVFIYLTGNNLEVENNLKGNIPQGGRGP